MSYAAVTRTRRFLNRLPQVADENDHFLHWHFTEFDDKNFEVQGHTLFYLFILFSIILFIVLLLLYARWYFRFRNVRAADSSHDLHAPEECKGLDPTAIKAMPIILHQESAVEREDQMECCICLGVFEDGDKVKVLAQCQHRFHSDCVDRWLLTQSSCPLCRVSLRVDPPKSTSDSALDIV